MMMMMMMIIIIIVIIIIIIIINTIGYEGTASSMERSCECIE